MGAKNIVGQTRQRVGLDQGHMFIGGRMQHHLDIIITQNPAHLTRVRDRPQDWHQIDLAALDQLGQFLMNSVKRQL